MTGRPRPVGPVRGGRRGLARHLPGAWLLPLGGWLPGLFVLFWPGLLLPGLPVAVGAMRSSSLSIWKRSFFSSWRGSMVHPPNGDYGKVTQLDPALRNGGLRLLVVARVRCRALVGVALPRGVRRVARGELARREVGVRRSDPLLEPVDLEAARDLLLLTVHQTILRKRDKLGAHGPPGPAHGGPAIHGFVRRGSATLTMRGVESASGANRFRRA